MRMTTVRRVMPTKVGIHVFAAAAKDVDGWAKPGHDGERG
jgi:hypothetical protein